MKQITMDELPIDFCAAPEVCANADENKEQHLLAHTTNEDDSRITRVMKRDKPLIAAIFVFVVIMNMPYLQYALYPFKIFSTWVHEMCHGMAAILVGGGINRLYVYKDGSGLAYTYTSGEDWKKAFVASAGYTGTAVLGCLLLLFRRTRRGPTVGTIGLGIALLLSCAFFVRNAFGIAATVIMGVAIILSGWQLPAKHVTYLYSFLAATCSFNAVGSISDLFAPGQCYVNGEPRYSDAHSVAEYLGMTYVFWATWWLLFALAMSFLGLVFVRDGITYKEEQRRMEREGLPVTVF